MSRKKKRSGAVIAVVCLAVLFAALSVGCFYAGNLLASRRVELLSQAQAEVEKRNDEARQRYDAALAEFKKEISTTETKAWPTPKSEGWDLLDLSTYPLENQTTVSMSRAEIMNNGMLLVNQWHSRPADFDESTLVGIGNHFNWKVQVADASVSLFPVAANALKEALDAAAAEDLEYYMVAEGYRSYDTQNTYFQNKVNDLADKYTGDRLIEEAKKDVNYPGTSEYNSGLAFRMRLYSRDDSAVSTAKYSTSSQGIWLNENCWKYGIVFRFPLDSWPLPSSQDKSFVTGISKELNIYRYVGKGNAAVMHYMDFCMEEYIEYLEEHPHIALFENGQLRYEIYRQIVGDSTSFNVIINSNAPSYVSSLDNMGGVITVFAY